MCLAAFLDSLATRSTAQLAAKQLGELSLRFPELWDRKVGSGRGKHSGAQPAP